MSRKLVFIAVTLLTAFANAYEMPVHARITQEAFVRSDLAVNSTELFFRLGFDRLIADEPFRTEQLGCAPDFRGKSVEYVDANGRWLVGGNMPPDTANAITRCTLNYERALMPPEFSGRPRRLGQSTSQLGPTPQLRFEAWFMRGDHSRRRLGTRILRCRSARWRPLG